MLRILEVHFPKFQAKVVSERRKQSLGRKEGTKFGGNEGIANFSYYAKCRIDQAKDLTKIGARAGVGLRMFHAFLFL
jgi:hypothetical protein